MARKLYQAMASNIDRINRNSDAANPFAEMGRESLESLVREYLPSGSGFDSGCYVETDQSRRDKIVIRCDFHHMDENGYYSGWTTHRAIVTPSLQFGFDLRITGKDKNGIKDYIADTIHAALVQEVEQ